MSHYMMLLAILVVFIIPLLVLLLEFIRDYFGLWINKIKTNLISPKAAFKEENGMKVVKRFILETIYKKEH